MRVLFASTYDAHGGAARAAYRLYQGVSKLDTACLVVKARTSDNPEIVCAGGKYSSYWGKRCSQLAGLLGRRQERPDLPPQLSVAPASIESVDFARQITGFQPDIVHLHWICNDFLSLDDIAGLRKPVLWTLHDAWPFTGGCHVPGRCLRYQDSCGSCPFLSSTKEDDWSRRLHTQKRDCYSKIALTVVAPSRWLAAAARSSSLLSNVRVAVIPNGLDVSRFRPLDKLMSRDILGLPRDRALILFGGMGSTTDPNKGFSLLLQALSQVSEPGIDAELVVFGASRGDLPGDFPVQVHFLGTLHDGATLALAYSAADVMVVPSIQEAFCQTASEAMACGVPVVSFRTSGLLDIVEHGVDGYAAEPFDPADLLQGIFWALDPVRSTELCHNARAKAVQKFSLDAVAAQYHTLYEQIMTLHDKSL
jgi:glycosyltransferase involved in cell wall biosynthesis